MDGGGLVAEVVNGGGRGFMGSYIFIKGSLGPGRVLILLASSRGSYVITYQLN